MQAALKAKYKNLITIPVPYAASLMTNVNTARTDAASIKKGIEAFNTAGKKCQVILAGGYSQGAAVMHNVVGANTPLDPSIRKRIVGVALFGDTRNKQDKGHILNFPEDRSKVWCNPNDGVCGGSLVVNMGHMSYGTGTIKEATSWLDGQVKKYVAANSGSHSRADEDVLSTDESPEVVAE
jgi:cutinase